MSAPPGDAPIAAGTVGELFARRVAREGDRAALRVLVEGGADRDRTITWREWGEAARRFAAALVASGRAPGERVAILAGSSPVWPIADLGIVRAGLVSVGLYPSSAPAQIRRILDDCGAVTLVVDTPARLERVLEVRDEASALRRIISLAPGREGAGAGEGGRDEGRPRAAGPGRGDDDTRWEDWLALGERSLDEDPAVEEELERRSAEAAPEDIAMLIYTSGSTGEPRGARISHRYLLASASSIRAALDLGPEDTTLSFLPHCHAAERVFGLYTRILCGMEAALVEDYTRVWDAARAYQPTVFGGLPRFYEKLADALEDGAPDAKGDGARDGADSGTTADGGVARFLGERLRLATSGGATLSPRVAASLERSGLTVLGAYGLTEHLCVAFNRPDRYALDAAGLPMPGTEIRIAEDGEILVRKGDLTFSGYHGRPEATRAAFTSDGEWLLTGDLGELDGDGFLRVTGRKKDLIALSTGKKIAPAPIEAALVSTPWIAQAVLHGEGRKFVSALLVPRRSTVEAWSRERGLDGQWPDLARHPEVERRIREAVESVNADLSRTERVRRFVLLERELTAERNEMTPTGKVRRFAVVERHGDRLEALYD